MSSRYKNESEVPTDVICDRLEKLSDAVTEGREAVSREFCMRIPAEVDRDADLVLSTASKRLRKLMDTLQGIVGTMDALNIMGDLPTLKPSEKMAFRTSAAQLKDVLDETLPEWDALLKNHSSANAE